MASFLLLNCCSSIIFTPVTMIDGGHPGYDVVYTGTKMNYFIVFSDSHHPHGPFGGPRIKTLAIIDFPFSFIFDTVFLPITLPFGIISDILKRRESENKEEDERHRDEEAKIKYGNFKPDFEI